jgi:hypothetical protein
MWINEDDLMAPASFTAGKRGSPCLYAEAVIQMLLGLMQVFFLPLRSLQGFAQNQRDLAFSGFLVPNCTTPSCRAQTLDVVLAVQSSREPLHRVVDSTGQKMFGDGEWKVCKHGYLNRRTWRKVHLAMDARIGQIGFALPDLLDQIPIDVPIEIVGGDSSYDTRRSHALISAWGKELNWQLRYVDAMAN